MRTQGNNKERGEGAKIERGANNLIIQKVSQVGLATIMGGWKSFGKVGGGPEQIAKKKCGRNLPKRG